MPLSVTPARNRQARPSGSPLSDSSPAGRTAALARPSARLVRVAATTRSVRRQWRRPVDLLWAQGGKSISTTIVESGYEQVAAAEPVQTAVTELPYRRLATTPSADMNRLVDAVISRLDRQARTERLRRGL